MIKSIIKYVVVALVAGVIGYVAHGGSSFAGVSHLSGLAVGADGLSTENGGTAVFGNTLSVAATTTALGQISAKGGILRSNTNSTSTTATSYTAVEKDFYRYSTVILTPTVNSLTLTLPASTTLTSMVPLAGDEADLTLLNGTTTAGKTITIAGGTGTLLRNATSTLVVPANSPAKLRFIRNSVTDVLVFVDIGQ